MREEKLTEDSIAQACLTVTWFQKIHRLAGRSHTSLIRQLIKIQCLLALWNHSHFTAVARLKQEGEPTFVLSPQHSIKHLHIAFLMMVNMNMNIRI